MIALFRFPILEKTTGIETRWSNSLGLIIVSFGACRRGTPLFFPGKHVAVLIWDDMADQDFTIGDFYDVDGNILSWDSDPLEAFLTYLDEIRRGAVGDLGLSLADFERHIAALKPTFDRRSGWRIGAASATLEAAVP
jgi:hypothetical protein